MTPSSTEQPARPAVPNWDRTSERSRKCVRQMVEDSDANRRNPRVLEAYELACSALDLPANPFQSIQIHLDAFAEMDAAHEQALAMQSQMEGPRAIQAEATAYLFHAGEDGFVFSRPEKYVIEVEGATTRPEFESMAHRIAACLNACAGIPDAALRDSTIAASQWRDASIEVPPPTQQNGDSSTVLVETEDAGQYLAWYEADIRQWVTSAAPFPGFLNGVVRWMYWPAAAPPSPATGPMTREDEVEEVMRRR